MIVANQRSAYNTDFWKYILTAVNILKKENIFTRVLILHRCTYYATYRDFHPRRGFLSRCAPEFVIIYGINIFLMHILNFKRRFQCKFNYTNNFFPIHSQTKITNISSEYITDIGLKKLWVVQSIAFPKEYDCYFYVIYFHKILFLRFIDSFKWTFMVRNWPSNDK